MAALKKVSEVYTEEEFALVRDPRTADWLFPGNWQLITLLLVGYVYVVKIAGPSFMKSRKPYDVIKPLIALYNLFMVASSAYFAAAFASTAYIRNSYSLLCQGIDFDARDEGTMALLNLYWWFVIQRIADFLDTLFFVLRKKDSHVSFLHVAHHAIVVFTGWFGLTYGPDGQSALVVVVNCCVHVIMYSYYFLSLLGPAFQKYLWWKRYLTQLQLAQFFFLFLHACMPLFLHCGYPRSHTYITLSTAVLFFSLFTLFYIDSYRSKKRRLSTKCDIRTKLH
ncbi:hypothetical protein V5799_011589 [Amblyomma americanum]|uniref:Elongation of very long chain fatty acids protein n=1 Tax=Amblyomma americanum TaxID=6943 RepID=A0AAQ4EGT8_AMBAM